MNAQMDWVSALMAQCNKEAPDVRICNCIGPQRGEPACPCAMRQQREAEARILKSYFDTTNLPKPELRQAKAITACQNAQVLDLFRKHGRPLTPSQVWRYGCDDGLRWLLTSVRRSMCVLTEADALVKLETKRDGAYGRKEYEWTLAGSQYTEQGVSDERSSLPIDSAD